MPVLAGVTSVYTISAGSPPSVGNVGNGYANCCGSVTSLATGSGGGSAAFSCASGSAVLVVVSGGVSGLTYTVNDSASNSYTAYPGGQVALVTNAYYQYFYFSTLGSNITSVTAHYSGTGSVAPALGALCISKGSISGVPDISSTVNNTGTSTTPTTGSITTGAATALAFFTEANTNGDGCTAPTSGWTIGLNNLSGQTFCVVYQAFSSLQSGITASVTLANSDIWLTVAGDLK